MNTEERLQILKMIETGQLSADEGAKLLVAVEESEPEAMQRTTGGRAQWMRIKVREGSKTKVNVNLPIALIEVAIEMGLKFAPENQQLKNLNVQELMQAIKQGARGKIVEVEDGDTSVEIVIE